MESSQLCRKGRLGVGTGREGGEAGGRGQYHHGSHETYSAGAGHQDGMAVCSEGAEFS